MSRLSIWASTYNCAIVLIGHLNKKEGTKGIYRSLGSIDVVAAARCVLQVERQEDNNNIRIVRQIKNSLAPTEEEIRFCIDGENGFRWLQCDKHALLDGVSSNEIEEPHFESKMEKAAYWINKILSNGDVPAQEVLQKLSEHGVGQKTAEKTKKIIGIKSYRSMRRWYWSISK